MPTRLLPRATGALLLLLSAAGLACPSFAQPTSASPAEWAALTEAPNSAASSSAANRTKPSDAALSHVVGRTATLYNRPDSAAPVASLPARTPLYRLDCSDDWCHVQTDEGRRGYLPATDLSNVWLRVSKDDRRLYLYRGPRLVEAYNIDVGYNTFADKKQRGSQQRRDHWRTPEGTFYVVSKNPQSQFYKALVLNYPTTADAERGLEDGLISRREYEAIAHAQEEFRMPPMDTNLGGWIEIHGEGTGAATNWTQGCVAVENRVMNQLWTDVPIGTPVLIE
jgi:lipoprotein-anchoring transpeptidase ErfK/SrfK